MVKLCVGDGFCSRTSRSIKMSKRLVLALDNNGQKNWNEQQMPGKCMGRKMSVGRKANFNVGGNVTRSKVFRL